MVTDLNNYDAFIQEVINEVNKEKGVNITPALVKAIIKQESQGNSNAVSGRGAIGLMQIMPDTAKELNPNADPFNPRVNIAMGITHLGTMMKMSKDLPEALARYNFGEGSVNDLIKQYGRDYHRYLNDETAGYQYNILSDLESQPGEKKKLQNIHSTTPAKQIQAANQPEKIAEQSPFKNPLDELGTRAYLQLVKTVPEAANKYLINRFGKDNVYTDSSGTTYVRPKGEENFFAVNPASADPFRGLESLTKIGVTGWNPQVAGGAALALGSAMPNVPDIAGEIGQAIPDLGRFIATTAGGIAGAAAGGPLGAAAGSASGEIAGDVLAAGAAAAGGATGEDIGQSVGGTLGRGALAGLFGGVGELAGPTLGAIGKKLRIAGNSGVGIGKMKGEIEQQVISDNILKQAQPAIAAEEASKNSINYFGQAAKEGIEGFLNQLDNTRNKVFDAADRIFERNLASGKVSFMDISEPYEKLRDELLKFTKVERSNAQLGEKTTSGLLNPAEQLLLEIETRLNGTKSIVRTQPDHPALSKFVKTRVDYDPKELLLSSTGFKPEGIKGKVVQMGTEFNPKQATPWDVRETSNYIRQYLSNPEFSTGPLSKVLNQFKTELTDIGANATDSLAKMYKMGFAISKKEYTEIPKNLENVRSMTGQQVADAIKAMPREMNEQLRKLVPKFAPETAQAFKDGLVREVLRPQTMTNTRMRVVPSDVSPEILKQLPYKTAQEAEEAFAKGIDLDVGNPIPGMQTGLHKVFAEGRKAARGSAEPWIKGQNLGVFTQTKQGTNLAPLFEDLPFGGFKNIQEAGKALSDAQTNAGIITTLSKSKNFQADQVQKSGEGMVEDVIRKTGGLGQAAMDILGGALNPLQRGAGNVMDTALGRMIPTQAVTSLAPALVGSLQYGTNISLAPALLGSLQYGTNVTPPSDEFLQNILRARGTRFVNGR